MSLLMLRCSARAQFILARHILFALTPTKSALGQHDIQWLPINGC